MDKWWQVVPIWNAIHLGAGSIIDPTEGNTLAENAGLLVGQTFGGPGLTPAANAPLVAGPFVWRLHRTLVPFARPNRIGLIFGGAGRRGHPVWRRRGGVG